MKRNFLFPLIISIFLILLCPFAWAEEPNINTEQPTFTLEVQDNLLNLQAEEASFKNIFNHLEKKAGIKVYVISNGIEDKKVLLNKAPPC